MSVTHETPITLGKTDPEADAHYPRIIGIEWRSGIDCVGIVAVQVNRTQWKAYIGNARIGNRFGQTLEYGVRPTIPEEIREQEANALKYRGGNTEHADAQLIAQWGAKLSEREAQAFFPWIWELQYAE